MRCTQPTHLAKDEQRAVRTLIRNECATLPACEQEFRCSPRTCPQTENNELKCRWFIEAVLPLNRDLQNRLAKRFDLGETDKTIDALKPCAVCGKAFEAKSNRARYCLECRGTTRRKQAAIRASRFRGKT